MNCSIHSRLVGNFLIFIMFLLSNDCLFYSSFAQSPLPEEITIEKIASGFQFTEGPCWRKAGYLVFSDISGNTVYKWTPANGAEVFFTPSGNSNGLSEDLDGRLLLAQHGNRCIARMEVDGTETTLATHYDGKRLNSPNDIAVKSDGSIYFTDPPYGINSSLEELGFYGVYRLSPDGSNLTLLVDSLYRPNGLAFSPDETKLYIADTNDKRILVYELETDGSLSNGKIFVTLSGYENPDGLTVDSEGNLYVACSDEGVQIFSPEGKFLDRIEIPERTRNLTWGDEDGNTLYITVGTSVYRIEFEITNIIPELILIPGGEFNMGDHHDLGGLEHGNDELPVHTVNVDSFYIGKFEITNQEFCDYLNTAFSQSKIEVRDGYVYEIDGTEIFCETYPVTDYSQINWDGCSFTVRNDKENFPVIGVRWFGAIAYCNWLSAEEDFQVCYDLSSGDCDFSKNGFHLPTEAEWEYAGRGGLYNPYYIFPWGDDENTDGTLANWPNSGDPYETGPYPWTTPVGFYDGGLHIKTGFNWPGGQESFQTRDGSNAYGLYDMSGNVWEWVYDWYGRDYYRNSPYNNPTGPETGTPMPDGKPYRTLRSGNWFNGEQYWGHSRVSNRNPSYYRGPDDPNHAWYHIGFRVVQNFEETIADVNETENSIPEKFLLFQNYPNPFNPSTTICYELPAACRVQLTIYNIMGKKVETLVEGVKTNGYFETIWDGTDNLGRNVESGIYFYKLQTRTQIETRKMALIK